MELTEAFEFGYDLAKSMKAILPHYHVASGTLETYGVLAQMVHDAGDALYLEIGTWRGASAIVAACTKIEFGLMGTVYCVDDFGGYRLPEDRAELSVTVFAQCVDNMSKYGVMDKIQFIKQLSRPYPDELWGMQFGSLYIDGDHWGDAPLADFQVYNGHINKYIMFDDDDEKHDVVQHAIDVADTASVFHGWHLTLREHTCALFERYHGSD